MLETQLREIHAANLKIEFMKVLFHCLILSLNVDLSGPNIYSSWPISFLSTFLKVLHFINDNNMTMIRCVITQYQLVGRSEVPVNKLMPHPFLKWHIAVKLTRGIAGALYWPIQD